MKTVEEMALEVVKKYAGYLGHVNVECIPEFVAECVAAVDAERGKAQLPVGFVDHGGIVYWHNKGNKPPANDTQLFLSPTIPEGMVLVPLIPTEEILDAMCDTSRAMPDDGDLVIQYNAILKAAGVTK